jgi:hypothetical protein
MAPYAPKYVSPKQVAEARARRRALIYWIAVAVPLLVAVLLYGYSDQAPAALRNAVVAIDGMFGHPILRLLGAIAGR